MRRSERAGKWPWYVPAAALWIAFLAAAAWYGSRAHPGSEPPAWMMTDSATDLVHETETIGRLLENHQKIRRTVETIPGGIRAVTTTQDAELVPLIRRHTRDMRDLFMRGTPVRGADPVYRELFHHRDRIRIHIEDVPLGVRVTETSDDPKLQILIRRRAQAESEFVRSGAERARQHTELPATP